jgi:hypothetical protein
MMGIRVVAFTTDGRGCTGRGARDPSSRRFEVKEW